MLFLDPPKILYDFVDCCSFRKSKTRLHLRDNTGKRRELECWFQRRETRDPALGRGSRRGGRRGGRVGDGEGEEGREEEEGKRGNQLESRHTGESNHETQHTTTDHIGNVVAPTLWCDGGGGGGGMVVAMV
jgi:hypothetical protein